MALVRWQPFLRDRVSLAAHMNRMFDEMLHGWGEPGTDLGTWSPRVDVYEKGEQVVVEAELPGINKEDIDIRAEKNVLILRGQRKQNEEIKEDDYYRSERCYGSFSRSFTLPATVDADKAGATYKDGVLTLTLPKHKEAKPKQISIK
jgi:HSP20 family protein